MLHPGQGLWAREQLCVSIPDDPFCGTHFIFWSLKPFLALALQDKDTGHVSNFGDPFLMRIRDDEQVADVKARIKVMR